MGVPIQLGFQITEKIKPGDIYDRFRDSLDKRGLHSYLRLWPPRIHPDE